MRIRPPVPHPACGVGDVPEKTGTKTKYNTKAANASRAAVLDTKHERTNRVRCSARMRDVLPALDCRHRVACDVNMT